MPPARTHWQQITAGHRHPPVGLGPLPTPFTTWRDPTAAPPHRDGFKRGRGRPSPCLLFLSSRQWLRPSSNAGQVAPSVPLPMLRFWCRAYRSAALSTSHNTAAGWQFPCRATYLMSHRSLSRWPSSCRRLSSTTLPIEPSPDRHTSVVSRIVEPNTQLLFHRSRL
jgi:hypothetical protein